MSSTDPSDLFEYLLRLGDDRLVLGHRLSEWCGHGPILEEDIALANISLDCIGQANLWLELAGETEGRKRSADDLAYFREAIEFRNLMLVELPIGDFAFTMARQFLFDCFSYSLMKSLSRSAHSGIAAVAAKCLKEDRYHLRHSREWVLRLGDGTDESRSRIQEAFDRLWMYTGDIFQSDGVDERLLSQRVAADLQELQSEWRRAVGTVLEEATLKMPSEDQYMISGSRGGVHTEHLGHLLAEMQILTRSYPDAKW